MNVNELVELVTRFLDLRHPVEPEYEIVHAVYFPPAPKSKKLRDKADYEEKCEKAEKELRAYLDKLKKSGSVGL